VSLKDELAAIPSHGVRRSKIDTYLDGLSDAERAEWLDALDDESYTSKQIATVLQRRGLNLSQSAIVLWRSNRRRGAR